MKITILTPLFPPDTGNPAQYVKELAARLDADTTVQLYGRLPESVPNVTLHTISKHLWSPVRVLLFTIKLLLRTPTADAVLLNNAPSTELPTLLLLPILKHKLIFIISDPIAEQAAEAGWYHFVHSKICKHAKTVIKITEDNERHRPEILPFVPYPTAAFTTYKAWWTEHLKTIYNHA